MGGKASIDGNILGEVAAESQVASELCLLLAFSADDGSKDEAVAFCGRSAGKVESWSSIDREKSTEPFRFRNGLLAAGEEFALCELIGESAECAAEFTPALLIVEPLEAAENSRDCVLARMSATRLLLPKECALGLLFESPKLLPMRLPPMLPRDAVARKSSEDSLRRRCCCCCCCGNAAVADAAAAAAAAAAGEGAVGWFGGADFGTEAALDVIVQELSVIQDVVGVLCARLAEHQSAAAVACLERFINIFKKKKWLAVVRERRTDRS
jgi:hypothetical protein